jgi:N-acetyl-gamma-glutamyl-phosphate reductase
MKAAIIGISGYTGRILLRLLAQHPEIKTIVPVSRSKAGKKIIDVDSGFNKQVDFKMNPTKGFCIALEKATGMDFDVVFAALPHLKSAKHLRPFIGKAVIVDLSADFRIKDVAVFKQAYGVEPPRADLLDKAVYGLCEWYGDEIKKKDIIANPGCYPTSCLLALLPLVKEELLEDKIIINSISGISGAGKKVQENLLFCERTENCGAYLPGKMHRHTPEIQNELKNINPRMDVFFTPHLAPLKRGIATTITAELKGNNVKADVTRVFNQYYKKEPFICLRGDIIPQTGDVWGSNRCDLGWYVEGNTLFIFSVIDNLVKGASGQAVQNMNIRFGLDQTMGLKTTAV